MSPATELKLPSGHTVHTRSLVAVAMAPTNVPAAHCAVTALQASPPYESEKLIPGSHAEHWRSSNGEPGLALPVPGGQAVHGEHASFPTVPLKRPAAQLVHVRSLDVVAALFIKCPAAHGALTSWHSAPSSESENVEPVHAAQIRLTVAEPTCDWPNPAGHVRQLAQAKLPTPALNFPSAQGVHACSLVIVASALT
jgi:hypothetical protein